MKARVLVVESMCGVTENFKVFVKNSIVKFRTVCVVIYGVMMIQNELLKVFFL